MSACGVIDPGGDSGAAAAAADTSATAGTVVDTAEAAARRRSTTTTTTTTTTASNTSNTSTSTGSSTTTSTTSTGSGTSNSGSTGLYKVQTIIDDMNTANTNGWYPRLYRNGADANGVPGTNHYAYVNAGIRSGGQSWAADTGNLATAQTLGDGSTVRLFPWGVMADAQQARNTAGNSRVQFRNYTAATLSRSGVWNVYASVPMNDGARAYGGWFNSPADSSSGTTLWVTDGSALGQGRSEASNGGGSSLGSIGYGSGYSGQTSVNWVNAGQAALLYNDYFYHFYPTSGLDKTRADWVNNVEGSLSCYEARLILHDPNGVDDRANANIMVIAAADYYDMSSNGRYWSEAYHSKFKLVTNDWQMICGTDISAAVLRANPPPGFSN